MIAWLGKILLAFNNITETAYDFKTGLEICCLNKYLRVHWNLINVLMWSERHLKNWLAKSSWQVWPVALSIFLLAMHVPENTHFRGEIITVWLSPSVLDSVAIPSYKFYCILESRSAKLETSHTLILHHDYFMLQSATVKVMQWPIAFLQQIVSSLNELFKVS